MDKLERAMSEIMHKHTPDGYIIRYKAIQEMLDRIETVMGDVMPDAANAAKIENRTTIMEQDIIATLSRIYQL